MIDALQTLLWLSVSGSIIAIFLILAEKLFKGMLSRKILYYLWLVVLLRLVLPVASPLGIGIAPNAVTVNLSEKTAVTYTLQEQTSEEFSEAYNTTERTTEYEEKNTYAAWEDAQTPAEKTQDRYTAADNAKRDTDANANAEQAETETAETISGAGAFNAGLVIAILWAAGAGISIVRNLFSYFRFTYHIRRTKRPAGAEDMALFRSMYTGKRLSLYRSEYVPTPILIGLIHPAIILPDNTDGEEERYVLMHELIHYKRCDILLKWFTELVISVHWFNPVMFLVRKHITSSCELSCDEAVVKCFDTEKRRAYGFALLSAAEHRNKVSHFAATLCDGKTNMKERLVNIMNAKKKTIWTIVLGISLVLVLTGCAVALGLSSDTAKSDNAASEVVKEVDNAAETTEPETAQTEAQQNTQAEIVLPTPAPTREPYEQKIYPYDAKLITSDKDEYTYAELEEGILLKLDYDLLSEYGIIKNPEDNYKILWWTNEDTTYLKDTTDFFTIYPKASDPGVGAATYTADKDGGSVKMYPVSKDAKVLYVSVALYERSCTCHVIFMKEGDKWIRHFDKPIEEAEMRKGYKEPKFSYVDRDNHGIATVREPVADDDLTTVDEWGKICLSKNEITRIALKEMYNLIGINFDEVYVFNHTTYGGTNHVAIMLPGKEDVTNLNGTFFSTYINKYTGELRQSDLWFEGEHFPTELHPKDVMPSGYKKMSPEKLALWLYKTSCYNAYKPEIVGSRVVMSSRDKSNIDCVILYTESGNSFEVDFGTCEDGSRVPIDVTGPYAGEPRH